MSDVIEIDGSTMGGEYIDIPDDELFKRPMPEDNGDAKEEQPTVSIAEDSPEDVAAAPINEDGTIKTGEVEDSGSVTIVEETPKENTGVEEIKTEAEKPETEDAPEKEIEASEEESKEEVSQLPKEVLQPLRAAGRDFEVKSVAELRKLAQFGIDYTKKMQALSPNLKLMKMLENNGLLDETKLSYLIDLDKKNPEAVAKLIQDSGHDALDLDEDKAKGYKPNSYTVDDKQMALDTILQDLEGSQGFQTTIDTVGNKWDTKSKQVVLDNPQMLKDINQHVESGVFQMVQDEITRQKTLGYLTGVSDFDAYKLVGDKLNEAGAFNALVQQPPQEAATEPTVSETAPLETTPPKAAVKDKKRAASLSKGTAPKKVTKASYNPLAMDDEEFMKIANSIQY